MYQTATYCSRDTISHNIVDVFSIENILRRNGYFIQQYVQRKRITEVRKGNFFIFHRLTVLCNVLDNSRNKHGAKGSHLGGSRARHHLAGQRSQQLQPRPQVHPFDPHPTKISRTEKTIHIQKKTFKKIPFLKKKNAKTKLKKCNNHLR